MRGCAAYSWILIALAVAAIAVLAATSDGLNDYLGRPLGTDFSNIYAAGKYALEGKPAAPFTPELQHLMEKRIFGPATPFYGWHYPPVFLAVAALLALLPYLPALIVWQAATLALYLKAMLAIAGDRRAWLPALAFPAVLINIGHGQNGFLTAALFGGGLSAARSSADRLGNPARAALLQAAVRHPDPAGAGCRRLLARVHRGWRDRGRAGRRELVRLRTRILGRAPRQPRLHANRGAGGRRHRLLQDPEPVCGVARLARAVAAGLCGADAARARGGRDRDRHLATRRRAGAEGRSAAFGRAAGDALTCSTTTSL